MVIFSSSSSTCRPFLLPIILIIICLFVAFSAAQGDDPKLDHYVGHTCSSPTSGNNAKYLQSLAGLVDELADSASTPGHAGFSWMSTRAGDRVYVLAQCRLDISVPNCRACVIDSATQAAREFCPNSRTATLWRDHCQLKYSDVDFFGQIDTDNKVTITNGRGFGSEHAAIALLSGLTQTALERNPFFAHGKSDVAGQTLYGMVQCTGDLNANDCGTCLYHALGEITNCCGQFRGARIHFGSCSIRRETFDFLDGFSDL